MNRILKKSASHVDFLVLRAKIPGGGGFYATQTNAILNEKCTIAVI